MLYLHKPAGDAGTSQHSMHGRMDVCYPGGKCDNLKVGKSGTGSALFYIDAWVFTPDCQNQS